jgi:hypothetical protein
VEKAAFQSSSLQKSFFFETLAKEAFFANNKSQELKNSDASNFRSVNWELYCTYVFQDKWSPASAVGVCKYHPSFSTFQIRMPHSLYSESEWCYFFYRTQIR